MAFKKKFYKRRYSKRAKWRQQKISVGTIQKLAKKECKKVLSKNTEINYIREPQNDPSNATDQPFESVRLGRGYNATYEVNKCICDSGQFSAESEHPRYVKGNSIFLKNFKFTGYISPGVNVRVADVYVGLIKYTSKPTLDHQNFISTIYDSVRRMNMTNLNQKYNWQFIKQYKFRKLNYVGHQATTGVRIQPRFVTINHTINKKQKFTISGATDGETHEWQSTNGNYKTNYFLVSWTVGILDASAGLTHNEIPSNPNTDGDGVRMNYSTILYYTDIG